MLECELQAILQRCAAFSVHFSRRSSPASVNRELYPTSYFRFRFGRRSPASVNRELGMGTIFHSISLPPERVPPSGGFCPTREVLENQRPRCAGFRYKRGKVDAEASASLRKAFPRRKASIRRSVHFYSIQPYTTSVTPCIMTAPLRGGKGRRNLSTRQRPRRGIFPAGGGSFGSFTSPETPWGPHFRRPC